jgi:hypothetical protein
MSQRSGLYKVIAILPILRGVATFWGHGPLRQNLGETLSVFWVLRGNNACLLRFHLGRVAWSKGCPESESIYSLFGRWPVLVGGRVYA